ncbi:hypothetical protein DSO57_1022118 [Entomophthora muscae]|uniref:Uncharacterized protein n=1 Tax=Entomophthora muscae TaxID=34485 RepID=A0ACC2SSP7_9FUNG|nr:hypothetical protein DSO57_1022118 [Entomophthora muscae]
MPNFSNLDPLDTSTSGQTPELSLNGPTSVDGGRLFYIMGLRLHPLPRAQVADIVEFIKYTDPTLSSRIQGVLHYLVQSTNPSEYALLIHSLAAAACFHKATLCHSNTIQQHMFLQVAINHYENAVRFIPQIASPPAGFDTVFAVLNCVKSMAQEFL